MRNVTRCLGMIAISVACSGMGRAQGLPEYRGFQLGASIDTVKAHAKIATAEAKTLHRRPALIQTVEWRPSYFIAGSAVPQSDPVTQMIFSFYDDQLYRIVVDYERARTKGMTGADLIAAISTSYGPASIAAARNTPGITDIEGDVGRPIARWGDTDSAIVLYQSSDLSSGTLGARFTLMVTSPRLSSLSRIAIAQSIRLDDREAPQREIERQKKDADDAHAAAEKAGAANKAAFKP